ncbi:MAG: hypothetical protein EHM18_01655 [Acidobacteria bacterium]|nr:MAG: hypothetical protein EHM18_01655 [Acidobacteriota bacterium]
MSERWCLLNSSPRPRTEEELRGLYGDHALITRLGQYNLIHLDSPDPEEIARRTSEFDPDDLFEDDCPLCQMLKNEHCDVVYDGSWDEDGAESPS